MMNNARSKTGAGRFVAKCAAAGGGFSLEVRAPT
jgi:hypothetical protein